jgi:hypothetical protein
LGTQTVSTPLVSLAETPSEAACGGTVELSRQSTVDSHNIAALLKAELSTQIKAELSTVD